MSAVTVREMTSTDIDALVEFDATLFADDAWPATTWWAELAERPRREYLVLEQDGALLAYGGVDHGGESADIMTVAVVREAQGRGHGAAMLDALEEAAGRRGPPGPCSRCGPTMRRRWRSTSGRVGGNFTCGAGTTSRAMSTR